MRAKPLMILLLGLLFVGGCDLAPSPTSETATPITQLSTATAALMADTPTATPTTIAVTPSPADTSTPSPTTYLTPTRVIPALKCGLTWAVVDTNIQGALSDVDAISSNDVWAVGSNNNTPPDTLITHWDGKEWNLVPSPNVGHEENRLYGVAAVSSRDVWAVGSYNETPGVSKSLVLHWDGAAWKIVPSPEPQGSIGSHLSAVAVVSKNDVWAVGSYGLPGPQEHIPPSRTMIQHWDGTRWRIVASPSLGDSNSLSDIEVVAKSDIWAVGGYEEEDVGFVGTGKTLTLHWNGARWTHVPSPNPPTWISALYGVAAVSTNDVWAVGGENGGEHVDPLAMHWDGKKWNIVPSPISTSHNGGAMSAVVAFSPADVRAVGVDPLGLRWNGVSWTWDDIPTEDNRGEYIFGGLSSIDALSPMDVWAVGGLEGWGGAYPNAYSSIVMKYADVPCPPATPAATRAVVPLPKSRAIPTATETPLVYYDKVCGVWDPMPGLALGNDGGRLNDVSVVSHDDIWAVGNAGKDGLIMHWDGKAWGRVPGIALDPPKRQTTYFMAVTAVSRDDVWAAGAYSGYYDNEIGLPMMIHWDGKKWQLVPNPNVNPGVIYNFTDMTAISSSDVWAVGSTSLDISADQTIPHGGFTMRWDGTAWHNIPIPALGDGDSVLNAISARAVDDAWAAGVRSIHIDERSSDYRTIALHWDGKEWRNTLDQSGGFRDVAAIAEDDVWAVGNGLVEHWNGAKWSIVGIPDLRLWGSIDKLAAISESRVWGIMSPEGLPAAQWDGTRWNPVRGIEGAHPATHFTEIVATSPDTFWVVGASGFQPFIARFTSSPCKVP